MVAETQNASLSRARSNKEDEFYTQREDVERELKHYRNHFKGKVVYLNCKRPTAPPIVSRSSHALLILFQMDIRWRSGMGRNSGERILKLGIGVN